MISSWNMLEMEYILKMYLLGGEFDNSEFCVYEKMQILLIWLNL